MSRSLIAVLAVASMSALALAGTHGMLTDNPSFTNVSNFTWSNPSSHNETMPVGQGDGLFIGMSKFDFDTYTATWTPTNGGLFGAGLAGHFTLDAGVQLKPEYANYKLGWAQYVSTSDPLPGNEWGITGQYSYPDTNNGRTSPLYPFQFIPGGAVNTATNPGFQDYPRRPASSGDLTWVANLTLMAYDPDGKTALLIDSMYWMFEVETGQVKTAVWGVNGGPLGFMPNTHHMGVCLTDAFDGNGVNYGSITNSTVWTIVPDASPFQIVPTPATFSLLALSGVVAIRRRR